MCGVLQVEAAYDKLFMHNMHARMTGQMNVKNSVRFADVPAKKPAQKRPQVRVWRFSARQFQSARDAASVCAHCIVAICHRCKLTLVPDPM